MVIAHRVSDMALWQIYIISDSSDNTAGMKLNGFFSNLLMASMIQDCVKPLWPRCSVPGIF